MKKLLAITALLLVFAAPAAACDQSLSLAYPSVPLVQSYGYYAPPVASYGYLAAPLPLAVPAYGYGYAAPAFSYGTAGYGASFGSVGYGAGFGLGQQRDVFGRGFGLGIGRQRDVFLDRGFSFDRGFRQRGFDFGRQRGVLFNGGVVGRGFGVSRFGGFGVDAGRVRVRVRGF